MNAAGDRSHAGGQSSPPDQGPRQRLPVVGFEGLAVTTEPVETIVYGPLADQEAVHRLLIKLESLGLEVVEFRRLPGEAGGSGVTPRSP
jgi:hypothetical protein